MKKFLLAVICCAGTLIYADTDLREKNFSKPAVGCSGTSSLSTWISSLPLDRRNRHGTVITHSNCLLPSAISKSAPFPDAPPEPDAPDTRHLLCGHLSDRHSKHIPCHFS